MLLDMLQHYHANDSEKHVNGVWQTLKPMLLMVISHGIIFLSVVWSVTSSLGFANHLCPMEIEHPDELTEVLGHMVMDWGARNGHPQKRPRGGTQSQLPSNDSRSEDMRKLLIMMGNLLIRHERDLAALQSQSCHILFLHAGPDGIVPSLIQQSLEWKKNKTQKEGLRQILLLHILTLVKERAMKIQQCKAGDPLLAASVKSKLLLEDKSWPQLQWCHQTKMLVINGKQPTTPMEETMQKLDESTHLCQKEHVVVRFHSLKSPASTDNVIPWKLGLDVKELPVHQAFLDLMHSSVWQLVSLRKKMHSLSQSKLADQIQQVLHPKSRK